MALTDQQDDQPATWVAELQIRLVLGPASSHAEARQTLKAMLQELYGDDPIDAFSLGTADNYEADEAPALAPNVVPIPQRRALVPVQRRTSSQAN